MLYEVSYGGETRFLDAGNPYQACLMALDAHLAQWDDVAIDSFVVNGEDITLDIIIGLRHMASAPLPERLPSEEAELAMETEWMAEVLTS
jgi:hypothetical protein